MPTPYLETLRVVQLLRGSVGRPQKRQRGRRVCCRRAICASERHRMLQRGQRPWCCPREN